MIKKECSGNYNKLILEKSKCVKKCAQDNKYKFEFKNRCYEECPEGTIIPVQNNENNTITDEYFCRPICSEETPFENIPKQECVTIIKKDISFLVKNSLSIFERFIQYACPI